MTTTSRATISLLAFGVLVLVTTCAAQDRPPIFEKMVKTYGLDSWDNVDALRYTWHLEWGTISVSRSWEWEPKANQVTYEGKDKDGKPVKVTYNRSQLSSQSDMVKNEVEPGFVNDNYTLIFPLRAHWDKSPAVIDLGTYNLPVGSGSAELIAVKYPAEVGGYTPGDTWELYVGKDGRAEYWIYERGGAKKPSFVFATWGGQKKAGPLLLSTDRRGFADGKPIRIWYTDVAVKVTGSDTWVDAK